MPDLPERMSGVQLTGHGGPERLVWSDAIPVPLPGPGEALVRVLAAGVNNTDINTRIGWYAKSVRDGTSEGVAAEEGGWAGALGFPRIQGGDLCGRVVALGEGVTAPPIGARVICANCQPEPTAENPLAYRVIGSEYDGAFAEYCAVPARHLYDVTAAPLSNVEVGAIPCNWGTAMGLVTRAGVSSGDRVLVTGASGGVGLAAVALSALRGANVTAQAGAAKHEAVREAGAADAIDRDATPEPAAYDTALDLVGGAGWGAVIDALRPGGRYAVSGAIAGPIVEADLRTIYLNDLTICGSTYQPAEVFAELVDLVRAGRIRPRIAATYPLSEIREAQAVFQEKSVVGKLVLIPPEEVRP
ncbi:MAG: alcohol dehydrogenase catalytic domain-containing protein [Paracoccaceae bacterium]